MSEAAGHEKSSQGAREGDANTESQDPASETVTTKSTGNDERYERLLKESQANAKKAKAFEAELEKIRQGKLKDEGKYKELADTKAKEAEEWRNRFVKNTVGNAIRAEAAKRGFIEDPALAERIGDHSKVELDPETGDVSGLDDYFAEIVKKHPKLFEKKAPVINGTKPGGSAPSKEQSTEERLKQKLREIYGQS
jgi:hypothetical protein